MPDSPFAMVCCQRGAEAALKDEVGQHGWRLAFSRPGFVTLKHDGAPSELPSGVFCRMAAWSIGKVQGTDAVPLLQQMVSSLQGLQPAAPFDQLHVWPRDRAVVGQFDFEPGPDPLSDAVAEQIHQRLRGEGWIAASEPNQTALPGQRVWDVVLVEPGHWWFGWHVAGGGAAGLPSRWPGGVQPIQRHEEVVSRAYFKAAEALAWGGFDLRPGQVAVEIGSSPGGACQRMLELGLTVVGIDPADMDPRVATHPRFTHVRARGGDLKRRDYTRARWLLIDANVRPEQTLLTVEQVVTHRSVEIEGVIVTLKLGDYRRAAEIPAWVQRVRDWGYRDVRVRQMATNRCEVCLVAADRRASEVPKTPPE